MSVTEDPIRAESLAAAVTATPAERKGQEPRPDETSHRLVPATPDRALPDRALEELIRLAAVLSGADYAYIGWMTSNRLHFKATHGFMAQSQERRTTPCQWV